MFDKLLRVAFVPIQVGRNSLSFREQSLGRVGVELALLGDLGGRVREAGDGL